jgi:crotonobetainyl-CoA:carnitine CoA-transferase CaiB-like acyl-CoA transferase
MLGGVFRVGGAPPAAIRPAPVLGADTSDVLREVGA